MSLSGLEKIKNIREIIDLVLLGNAESNAEISNLIGLIEAWPNLKTSIQTKILKLAH